MKDLRKELDNKQIFISKTFTYGDFVNQLFELQNVLCTSLFGENYDKSLRMGDLIYKVKQDAIEKGMTQDEDYYQGIKALKELEKQIAISVSGKKAEDNIDFILKKYVTRDDFVSYRNVYLEADGEGTEIDHLVLTKDGFIILEIKNIKSDVTIDEEGRMFIGNDSSYDQATLIEKMDRKKRMLYNKIKKSLKSKGYCIDVDIDAYVVFNERYRDKKHYINNYSDIRYLRSSNIGRFVQNHHNNFGYSDDEFDILKQCCSELPTDKKQFKTDIDYISVREKVCVLFDKVYGSVEHENPKTVIEEKKHIENKKKSKLLSTNRILGLISTACTVVGAAMLSASIVMTLQEPRR